MYPPLPSLILSFISVNQRLQLGSILCHSLSLHNFHNRVLKGLRALRHVHRLHYSACLFCLASWYYINIVFIIKWIRMEWDSFMSSWKEYSLLFFVFTLHFWSRIFFFSFGQICQSPTKQNIRNFRGSLICFKSLPFHLHLFLVKVKCYAIKLKHPILFQSIPSHYISLPFHAPHNVDTNNV